jgi:hypothetical protein
MTVKQSIFGEVGGQAGSQASGVDLGILLGRLLLFDTVIVKSAGLREVPHLVRALGKTGFRQLHDSGVLKFSSEFQGPLSARPSTCTAGAGATGVAYWETDRLQLDFCIVANTWGTLTSTPQSYAPFTYPHPLVNGSSGPVTLSPSSESFGLFNVGASSSPAIFTVTNNSTTTATSISIPDTDSAEFPITNSGAGSCAAASGTLAANASCTFTVKFSPTSAGIKTPTLSVSYSGGDGASPQTAGLSGAGVSVTAPAAAMMAILKPDPMPGPARFSVAQ